MTGYLLHRFHWIPNYYDKYIIVLDKQDAFELYMSLCEEELYERFCENCDSFWIPGLDGKEFFQDMVNITKEKQLENCWCLLQEVPIYGNFSS